MNLFQKISLIGKVNKAVKEINKLKEANSEIADKIKEIIDDIINVLNKLKEVVPAIDNLVEEVIAIIKKWFNK